MDSSAALPVEVGEWMDAPFAVKGETIFAIGDVHGCAPELRALLGTIAELARQAPDRRRLIYLGDIINRGPDSIGALELWARNAAAHDVDHVDRLMGNHEIVMLLGVIGGPHARHAHSLWLSNRMGGHTLLQQMRAKVRQPEAPPSVELLAAALGDAVVHQLYAMRSHVRIGNALFVHGGLDPQAD
jgi:serine/threonine protein phosphatase 1